MTALAVGPALVALVARIARASGGARGARVAPTATARHGAVCSDRAVRDCEQALECGMDSGAGEAARAAEQPEHRAASEADRRSTTALRAAGRADDRRGDALRRQRLLVRLAAGRPPARSSRSCSVRTSAGADGGGVNAAPGELVVEHLGEPDERALAGAVGRVAGTAEQAELRGDESRSRRGGARACPGSTRWVSHSAPPTCAARSARIPAGLTSSTKSR